MKFAAAGKLNPCFLFTYRFPEATARKLLPSPLEAVTKNGWAFLSIFACGVENFRPRALPAWLGMNYRHVAYRIFARAPASKQETVTGMYFLRSDVDRVLLAATGNWSSDLHFRYADIALESAGGAGRLQVQSRDHLGTADVSFNAREKFERATGSCFADDAEALAFLKYQPVGIAMDSSGKNLKLVEVTRSGEAAEKPIRVTAGRWDFFQTLGINEANLELATEMTPVACIWQMGRLEPVAP